MTPSACRRPLTCTAAPTVKSPAVAAASPAIAGRRREAHGLADDVDLVALGVDARHRPGDDVLHGDLLRASSSSPLPLRDDFDHLADGEIGRGRGAAVDAHGAAGVVVDLDLADADAREAR